VAEVLRCWVKTAGVPRAPIAVEPALAGADTGA